MHHDVFNEKKSRACGSRFAFALSGEKFDNRFTLVDSRALDVSCSVRMTPLFFSDEARSTERLWCIFLFRRLRNFRNCGVEQIERKENYGDEESRNEEQHDVEERRTECPLIVARHKKTEMCRAERRKGDEHPREDDTHDPESLSFILREGNG